MRATVVELLADLGYRVLTARDAASALSVIESGMPIDLLFTDVVMPGKLRSPELARLARERHARARRCSSPPAIPRTRSSTTAGSTPASSCCPSPTRAKRWRGKLRQVLACAGAAAAAAARAVLLVEDDALIRMNTADVLTEAGMTGARGGVRGAGARARRHEAFDVCVVDVGLPDMSGIVLAERIRALHPGFPVLFATGHAHVPEADGMERVAVLSKPYDEITLRAAIERLLGS